MTLSNAVPREAIFGIFPLMEERIQTSTVPEFLIKESAKLPGACMFIWDEMVHRGDAIEPFKIAPIINNDYKGIYEFVSEELGDGAFKEAFSTKFFNEYSDHSFADVVLVHCYPNDIHICDVEFSDNRSPLEAADPTKQFREYKGLHIFDQFLDNLRITAKDIGADRLSLMVATPPLHEVFTRHGFQISDTETAQIAYASAGTGHPMIFAL